MKHNLVINGIDYNTELDLLSEYNNNGIYGRNGIVIDIATIPKNIAPLEILKIYRQTGDLLFLSNNDVEFTELEPLTFEQWKRNLTKKEDTV